MPLDPSLFVTCDHLAVACEGDRLDRQRGLFTRFAEDGIDEGLSGLNGAARQGVKVKRGIARPPDEKHLAVADDGGADCQVGTLRVVSLFGHAFYRFISLSTTSCGVYALFSSESPLMSAPARAISGFNQPMAFPASAATVSGRRSASSIAARVASSTIVIVTASVSRLLRMSGSALS